MIEVTVISELRLKDTHFLSLGTVSAMWESSFYLNGGWEIMWKESSYPNWDFPTSSIACQLTNTNKRKKNKVSKRLALKKQTNKQTNKYMKEPSQHQ